MKKVVEKRISPKFATSLVGKDELVEYLAMASFGLPCGFLNMLSNVLGVDEEVSQKVTRQKATQAIVEHAESVRFIFRALASKLPRFRRFVESGTELEGAIVKTIKQYNNSRSIERKAVAIAVQEPLGPSLERVLQFMEYAGLVRQGLHVSRGVKGTFQRYSLHYAIITSENALSLGKSFSVESVVEALVTRNAHSFVRSKGSSLLGPGFEKRCTLDLPPCARCKAARATEDQKFCMKCGAELPDTSIYAELLKAPIDKLPLKKNKLNGIRQHTRLKCVQDILTDDQQTLRTVPYVGPVWARRIRTYAEEFVSV